MISSEVERLKASFLRDVEIDAVSLEVHRAPSGSAILEVGKPSASPVGYDVFVSFAAPDVETAERATDLLKAQGLKGFFSRKELQGGDPWEEKIRTALVGSRELCLIVSKASLPREWVLTEWGAAWATQKRITPVLVDCTVVDLPDRLRSKQCVALKDLESYALEVAKRLLG